MSFRRLETQGDVEEVTLVEIAKEREDHSSFASLQDNEEGRRDGEGEEGEREGEAKPEDADRKTSLITEEDEIDEQKIDEQKIDEDGIVREYEVALEYVGFGLFHFILLAVNGLALSSDAVEILSISFVLPIIREEFDLHDWQNAFLSSVIFIGMLFGGYVWGGLSDLTGRRHTVLMSLAVNGVFGLTSAFAPNYWLFVLFRFISGVG